MRIDVVPDDRANDRPGGGINGGANERNKGRIIEGNNDRNDNRNNDIANDRAGKESGPGSAAGGAMAADARAGGGADARRIRVLLAEDQALVLGALAALLRLEPDLEVVGMAGNGQQALLMCATLLPDVVLTDIEMPLMTGLELAATLKAQEASCKVVIVTTFARTGYLRRALAAGVRGYLLKDAPADTLAAAIRTVHAGGRAVAPELALEIWQGEPDPLSERERQVLRLAGEGKSTADIARLISLSEGTVRNYLSEAISKLNAGNRVEAFRLARDAGWL